MLFSTLVAALLATASAVDISTTSEAGAKLLSKARSLNGQYEDDFSWMAKYSLKFEGCHTIHTYGGEGQNAEEGGSPFGVQHLAKFKLCNSSKSCSTCTDGGTYMVELQEFAQAYLEAEKEIQQANCQAVEESCNCEYYYGDDQACLNKCYSKAGLSYCGEEENEFDASEYMECREVDFGNNNYYNNNGAQYYIGPVCSHSGKKVTLAVFSDAQCTKKASSNIYEKYNYGASLPYSSEPLISTKCMSCKVEEENDGNGNYYNQNKNAYYNAEASDTCTQLYEQSAKCEKSMSVKNSYTKDTGSCEYIHNIVPALENVYHSKGSGVATGFAIFFALTTIGASGAAYWFYSKVERSTVGLAENEGGNFA